MMTHATAPDRALPAIEEGGVSSRAIVPAGNQRLHTLMHGLLEATDFVTVAATVCRLGNQLFGLCQCVVSLYETTSSHKPAVLVDNVPGLTDELRMYFLSEPETWVLDPFLRELRLHHVPVGEELVDHAEYMRLARASGYTGPDVHTLLLPIVGPGGLLGSIQCGCFDPFTEPLRRDLTVLSSHVSVRLAQLGVTGVPNPSLALLTRRQIDVAQLAARGRTNQDIAQALKISDNTIKKHLKHIFEVLGVSNRAELATLLTHAGPQHRFPAGISRLGELTITTAR